MQHELIDVLRQIVGQGNVLIESDDCAPYEGDWRGRYRGRALCVVRPAFTEEVARVVQACAAAQTPIVPQGGNTSHCGGSVPHASASEVVISLMRMNRIRDIDLDNNTMTVEAGCILEHIQRIAAENGRLFPLSLAAEGSCAIGGNIATNAGGVQVLRYGNARELTLGLEVVLADGQVWEGLKGLRKDNTGYDLRDLFVGSEGTLGIITCAVIKLFPLPACRVVAWVALSNVQDAIGLLNHTRKYCGERASAFEIIGERAMELVLRHMPDAQPPLQSLHPWYALIELTDSTSDSQLRGLLEDSLAAAFDAGLIQDAAIAFSEAQADALWALREDVAEAQKREGISIKHDISVPVSRIPEFLARAEEALERAFPGVRIVAFGHAGDGNLHYNLSMPDSAENAQFIPRTPEANRVVHDLVAQYGGSISAEHGLGQLKREEIKKYKSPVELEMMRRIKQAFDPEGLFNPGKFL